MFDNLSEDNNPYLSKFEQMLKTNQVLFFDALEFENIIHHYIDFAQFNLAKKAIKMGMDQHPQNVELMLLKSEILLFDGAHKEAEDLLVEIERISPENEEIFLQRANLFSKKKNHPKAIQLLEKALEVTDDPVEIWNLMGMEYLFLEDYIKAKQYFCECVKENSFDYQSLYNLLYCYEQLGENIEAISTLNNLLEINPYSEVAWHQLGKIYIRINKFEEALSAFEFAIISDDCFTGAYIEKGKLLEKMGRINEAIDNYEFSLNFNDPNAFINHRIGLCHLKLGNDKLAIKYLEESIKLEPNHENSWLALIDFLIETNNYLKARYYVNKSLQSNSDSRELWKKSAQIHFHLNFYMEASVACETTINLGDHDTDVWTLWVDSLILTNDWHKALEIGQQALQYDHKNPSVLFRLAGCKYRLGNTREALQIFDKIKNKIEIPGNINHLFPELIKI
ncbi:MAG: tetratricopeptide repeat protein [Bacteroidota bacterium]|nr:tetratricopeptide repeat protein [Bacteroidota bacterium]